MLAIHLTVNQKRRKIILGMQESSLLFLAKFIYDRESKWTQKINADVISGVELTVILQ
jgi:hypothetical protein